jgi:hypothetical protein
MSKLLTIICVKTHVTVKCWCWWFWFFYLYDSLSSKFCFFINWVSSVSFGHSFCVRVNDFELLYISLGHSEMRRKYTHYRSWGYSLLVTDRLWSRGFCVAGVWDTGRITWNQKSSIHINEVFIQVSCVYVHRGCVAAEGRGQELCVSADGPCAGR